VEFIKSLSSPDSGTSLFRNLLFLSRGLDSTHCVLMAGFARVFRRIATGSKSVEHGCTWTKAWLEFTVNNELELRLPSSLAFLIML